MTTKKVKSLVKIVISATLSLLYVPIYFLSWCLHKVARLLLAISYMGLLDFIKARDILKYMFRAPWKS